MKEIKKEQPVRQQVKKYCQVEGNRQLLLLCQVLLGLGTDQLAGWRFLVTVGKMQHFCWNGVNAQLEGMKIKQRKGDAPC